jgi:hypothetical protein
MVPESDEIASQENEQLYDARLEGEPTAGGRA